MRDPRSSPSSPPREPRAGAARRRALLGAALLLLVAAFALAAAARRPAAQEPEAGGGRLLLALHAEPAQISGETYYVLTLAAASAGPDGETLTFPNGQLFDFAVLQDGREVWRWSRGRAFHQAVVQRPLAYGELLVFNVVWDGRTAAGDPVQGEVELQGWLTAAPPRPAPPMTLRLGE